MAWLGRSRQAGIAFLTAALAASSTACDPSGRVPSGLPGIPDVSVESMSPQARELIHGARTAALSNPGDAESAGRLGMALQAYQLRGHAEACYLRARALAPGDWRWPYYLGVLDSASGRHDRAAERFAEAMASRPGSLSAALRLGHALLADGRFNPGLRVFESAVRLAPDSAAAHYGMGRALQAGGSPDRALRAYGRAIELAPDSGASRYARAVLYRELGHSDSAAKEFAALAGSDRAEPAWPDPLMAAVRGLRADKHQFLSDGLALEEQGLVQEAAAEYEKAVRVDDGYVAARVNLVSAYGKLGRFADAERHYRAALEAGGASEELHVNWGTLLVAHGRLGEAARSYRAALEINPSSAGIHADLAGVLERLGRPEEAHSHYQAALRYEPGHRAANFHLARRLVDSGRPEEAVKHLLKARDPVDERTPAYLYGLADAYVRSGSLRKGAEVAAEAATLARQYGQQELAAAIDRDLAKLGAALAPPR